MAIATLEKEVLDKIKISGGIKRVHLKPLVPAVRDLLQLRMILAELLAKGEIIEIEYTTQGITEFYYIAGNTDIRIRGKGI
jgi:hypothetical protein